MRKKELLDRYRKLIHENDYLRTQLEEPINRICLKEAPKCKSPMCYACIFAATVAIPTFNGPEVWILGCVKDQICSDFKSAYSGKNSRSGDAGKCADYDG